MHKLTAIQIREKFVSGEKSALEITDYFLRRIDEYDGKIGAFLEVFRERSRKKAAELDKRKSSGKPPGKMAAIPVVLKDNIHLKGETTTCGSKFLVNFKAPFNATVTELLEAEDAIILGKTNMDEFAMGSSVENSALQTTRNPWNLACVPGGSSGGSSAAVAARLAPLALGSDTGGSIRQPASLCGVVGFKPTYGRVSRFGLVAFASSCDQIGPLAISVADAALAMEVIGKHCARDSTSYPMPSDSYLRELTGNIDGLKIGIPHHFLERLADEPRNLFLTGVERLKKLGASIIDIDLDILRYSLAVYYILATAEASTNLARFDGVRYGVRAKEAKTLDELYDLSKEQGFGREVKRRILLGTFVLSSGYKEAYYKKAQKVRTLIIERFKQALSFCDAITMPTSPSAAFEIGTKKDPLDMYLEDIYTIFANLTGAPAISVPNGFTQEGKPVGLQIIGPRKKDALVLRIADAFERAGGGPNAVPPLFNGGVS